MPNTAAGNSPALTRSAALSRESHSFTRPNSLSVSPWQPAAIPDAYWEEEDGIQSSEEERTLEGGRREFVGHTYRSPRLNNGEIVTPEKSSPPQNMIVGYSFPLEPYRRQFSENNRRQILLPYEEPPTDAQRIHVHTLQRQLSEPVRGRCYRDNNGRII